jgi:hypothetical protein
MCLKWLHLAPLGQAMIDYGCGSGILTVAACLFGAKHVVGPFILSQLLPLTKVAMCHSGLAELEGVEQCVHHTIKSRIASKDDNGPVSGNITSAIWYVMSSVIDSCNHRVSCADIAYLHILWK